MAADAAGAMGAMCRAGAMHQTLQIHTNTRVRISSPFLRSYHVSVRPCDTTKCILQGKSIETTL